MKITGSSIAAAPLGAVVAWAWNGFVGEPAMTVEVSAVIAGLLGVVVAYLVSWLPKPR